MESKVGTKPKVSVIIPVYNDSEYLCAALESVKRQTMKEIEVICVDDASEDNSRDIIKEYQEQDPRFKAIFHETNLSASEGRKNGVAASTGKYIMFLDGDDELYPDACQAAYDAIEKYGTDMVHFNSTIVNCANMTEARIQMNVKHIKPYIRKIEADNLISACWKEKKFAFTLWNKIYNGDICRLAFSRIEPGAYPKAQDLYAFFVIAYYSRTYMGIDETLYKYNFGLGITGDDNIDLRKYSTLLTESRIYGALVRFMENKPDNEEYEEILESVHEGLFNECFVRWRDNLSKDLKNEGFELLVGAFGFKTVLRYLSKKFWYNRTEMAKEFVGIPYFNYIKREPGKQMTIAMYYRCIVNGGAQRVVSMLCNRWADMVDEEGKPLYNVVLITDEGSCENEYEISPLVKRRYLPRYEVSISEKYKERMEAWHNLIDENDIDVVVSGMWVAPSNFWDMLCVKGHKSKPAFVIHSHSFCMVPYQFLGDTGQELCYSYQICDGVVVLSECDHKFVSSFAKHSAWICNPLAFSPLKMPTSSYEPNRLLWLGRISEEKNPVDSIIMMKYVVKKVPDAKLYIVGGGNQRIIEKMQSLVTQLQLENNVELVGFTLNVQDYYSKSMALICTSKYEGWSLTLGEAMAHGIPVITYDMPWLTFLQDGRGIVTVPQERYDLLARELISLHKNPNRIVKIGMEGKQQIIEVANYDIESDWKEFFAELNKEKTYGHSGQTQTDILLKYLSLYQYEGRKKRAAAEKKKGAEQERRKFNASQRINNEKIKKLENDNDSLNDVIYHLEHSVSFRVGRMITWFPRMIRDMFVRR